MGKTDCLERMKVILFTMTLGGGGAERVLTLLANGLVSRGYEVILLTLSDPAADFYPLIPQVRRIGLGLTFGRGALGVIATNAKRAFALRAVLTRERAEA